MSQENVEIVRQLQPDPNVNLVEVELFQTRGDDAEVEAAIAAAAPAFTDDFVCIFHTLSEEPRPGVRGLRQAWVDWLAPWESYRAEIKELRDAGDAVLVVSHDFGRRPGMEKEVEFRGSAVWTVRDGRVAKAEFFTADRAGALEAAGLSE
jgi:ketosteroid isomerase-like protein